MSNATQRYEFKPHVKHLRYLAWTYIILLILEGALRKWFLPSVSNLLLLARDPVILLAYIIAFAHGLIPRNKYIVSGIIIVGLSFVCTVFFAHGNLVVAAYGFRANILHFPFAFIMGMVFFRRDVIEIGKWWLWATLGMTALICVQFYSPQSAWVNVGPGGVGSAGFGGALGRFRPPGTFSFIIGVVWFYVFATAFLVSGFTQHRRYSKTLMALAAVAIIIAVPVSISRMLALACVITLAVGIITSSLKKHMLLRYGRLALFGITGFALAASLPVFDDAREAFMSRWADSTKNFNESIIQRTLKEFTYPFNISNEVPVVGYGLGAGTQVGSYIQKKEKGWTLGEADWQRITNESGYLLGGLFILWRVAVCLKLYKLSMRANRRGNSIAVILFSATAYNLLVGALGQATVNGFIIVGIGLTLASMRQAPKKEPEPGTERVNA